jgi:hypothetical protein
MLRSIHRNAFRTEEDLPKILTDDTASGKPQLEYPFEAPPNRGATIDVASGVRWIRMPLPYALDHVNLWAIDEANGCAVIDTGLNNEETLLAWQTILIWSGTYHTAMEGALRVPFMIRWPGFVEPGRVTNEILHVTTYSQRSRKLPVLRFRAIARWMALISLILFLAKQKNRRVKVLFTTSNQRCARQSGEIGRCTSCGSQSQTSGDPVFVQRCAGP